MTTPTAELEMAFAHILRAEELAPIFAHKPETISLLGVLKRATAKVRKELIQDQKVKV